jgi:tetratricopeptide (TPR) repeat protein
MSEGAVELQARAWQLQAEGRLEQAFEIAEAALRCIEGADGADSPDAANLLNDLADIARQRQDFDSALGFARRARIIEYSLGTAFSGDTAAAIVGATLALLGDLYRVRGDYRRAERKHLEGLELAEATFGADSEASAVAHNYLAVLYKYAGRFREARELYKHTLGVMTRAFGPRSLQVSVVLHNIGGVSHAEGEHAAAEAPARQAWEISRELLGEEDEHAQLDATAYAAVLDGLGRYAESEPIYRRVHAAMGARYGGCHLEVAAVEHNLAAVLHECGRLDEAEALYRSALHTKMRLLDARSPDLALTLNNLGRLLRLRGRLGEAKVLAVRAAEILERSLPADHPSLIAARRNLSLVGAGLELQSSHDGNIAGGIGGGIEKSRSY